MVLLVGAASIWVLMDARSREARGRPVVMTVVGVTVDRPEVWAALCLVAVVIFMPAYLVARRAG